MSQTPAATIRNALRTELGLTSRQVSVRTQAGGLSTAVDVTIKEPGILLADVEEIANRESKVRRCEVTDEVLGGGSTYISVGIDSGLTGPLFGPIRTWIETIPVGSERDVPGGEKIRGGLRVCRDSEWKYTVFTVWCHQDRRDDRLLDSAYLLAELFVETATPWTFSALDPLAVVPDNATPEHRDEAHRDEAHRAAAENRRRLRSNDIGTHTTRISATIPPEDVEDACGRVGLEYLPSPEVSQAEVDEGTIRSLATLKPGSLEYRYHSSAAGKPMEINARAGFPLLLIRKAWEGGVDFEDLADGFGASLGTMGGDWSGIRDSSPGAIDAMLMRSLNRMSFEEAPSPLRNMSPELAAAIREERETES